MNARLERLLSRFGVLAAFFFTGFAAVRAQETLCARVVIRIEQELTLEREGFEARLGITNGLPSSLDNLQVTLAFTDADGGPVTVSSDAVPNASGRFYYRIQTGYSPVTSVASGGSAKMAYLIVPSIGAAGESAQGTLYYIGATVKYTVAGIEQTEVIAPDFVYVRPMPQLQLQYFLPGNVFGDDPLTPEVKEPSTVFPLGARIINHSAFAPAKKVKIDSGQPEIVDNQQGLLVAFQVLGCRVNDSPVQPSLLVDFGDIGPQRAAVASWDMTSSLSGRFVRFTAQVSHAADLGGALTSLIPEDAISTHRLLHQVVVDLPGRDSIRDFLATDAMTGEIVAPRIYESGTEEVSVPVDYFPPDDDSIGITSSGASAVVTLNAASAAFLGRVASPVQAAKLVRAVRSDEKVLPSTNAWIDVNKTAEGSTEYWLNLFDTDKSEGQSYALTFVDPAAENRPPVLKIVGGPNFTVSAGQPLKIGVLATDPDGESPSLLTGLLPFGASFEDRKEGSGLLEWSPTFTQLGNYTVQFKATDGKSVVTGNAFVTVVANGVEGFSSWQRINFPFSDDPLVIGPSANPDGDQLSNLLEYALGGDPNTADDSVLPDVSVEMEDGARYLTLTYRKRTGDTKLRYEVVSAAAVNAPLAEWTVETNTRPVEQTDLPSGMERVSIRDSVPVESAPRRYLRLRVTSIEIE